ncbi:CaiB/BaiF CoA-transferase family protein [Rhodococcus opacus]|uniref:CaiB/BaiF CoA transferase family protein n=1 Tax=Rhodococcus sp. LB1 TaxID=1807499 RepID=UPI0007C7A757|nr:CaiB/BaiF CoA-transferase family protein [Rhodococcus sp. LB1]WKN60693.1 CaiB/BaiF CoA-transferase family protein [Rhodococcus opacus]
MSNDWEAPLTGVKVLDFTHGVAGPYASMLLGDLGAAVWKIERPRRGDPTRYMNVSDKFASGAEEFGGDYFLAINRNKRSVGIDLSLPEGRDLALRLAANADIVLSNFRPGVMDRLGLGVDALREVNPGLIVAELSAYGVGGELAGQPGMDVAIQARAGVMSITGYADDPRPVKPGASIADFGGGAHFTVAILAALHKRSVTGKGSTVQISLLDAMVSLLMNYSVAVIDGGAEIGPMGSGHPQLAPFAAFDTADGHIVIATGTNKLWRSLCQLLGRDDLVTDLRFETNVHRVQHRDELEQILNKEMATKPTSEWQAIFESQGIPSSPVNRLSEAFREPQLWSQGLIAAIEHPEYGEIHQVVAPYLVDDHRMPIECPPPSLGADTAEVLADELGLSTDDLSTLRDARVI